MSPSTVSTVLIVGVPLEARTARQVARWAEGAGLTTEQLCGHLVTLGARMVEDVATRAEGCPVVFIDSTALEVTP